MAGEIPTVCPDPELLTAFVDASLERADTARVAAHVPACADCTATLAALSSTTTPGNSSSSLRKDAASPSSRATAVSRSGCVQRLPSTSISMPCRPAWYA